MEHNFNGGLDHKPCTNDISPIDVQLLLSSIHNTDELVRKYHTKCFENDELQKNLVSLNELSTQIRQLYASEQEKNEKLVRGKQNVDEENQRLNAELAATQHEHINSQTLQSQTIAELEYQLETTEKENVAKYLDLCELFVAQGLILHTNGLSTTILTRKCSAIRATLKSHNRRFEWTDCSNGNKNATKATKSPTKATAKCKCVTTTSPTKNAANANPMKRVITCEKGTMFTQTTATRSTCTSAFITKTDASTNTSSDEMDIDVESIVQRILDEMVPMPPFLPPIYEPQHMDNVNLTPGTNASTQTANRKYRNQGTITRIQNVRKHLDYNNAESTQSMFNDSLACIKKENLSTSFGSMSNLLMSQHVAPEIGFWICGHLWLLLGEIMFPTAVQNQQTVGYQKQMPSDPKFMEKLQQIQSMFGVKPTNLPYNDLNDNETSGLAAEPMTDLGDKNVPSTSLIKETASDCSQDSIRSYDSGRVVVSKVRDFSKLSSFTDDNSVDASQEVALLPVPSLVENVCKETSNLAENRPNLQITIPMRAIQIDKSIASGGQKQQFKVPKRRLAGCNAEENIKNKKRKTVKTVNTHKLVICKRVSLNFILFSNFQTKSPKTVATSNLFEESNDQFNAPMEDICEYFSCPKMLSPIRDLPDDENCEMSAQTTLIVDKEMERISPAIEPKIMEPNDHESNEMEMEEISADIVGTNNATRVEMEILEDPHLETITEETILAPNQIKPIELDIADAKDSPETMDDYYSPASPPPEQYSTAMPSTIPLHTQIESIEIMSSAMPMACANDSPQSIFDRLIKGYSHATRSKLCTNLKTTLDADESYTIASLRNAIETLCMQSTEWTSTAITDCVEKMLKLTWRPMLLAKALLEVIEDTIEPICFEFTPPSPAMTRTHQKCLLLIVRIDQEIPSFKKYIEYQLERNLFQFRQNLQLSAMINLTHLHIALIDLESLSDRPKVRLFIYKCLYYYTQKAIPMIYAMLMAHPHCLPHANAVNLEMDPLVRAIISIMTNIQYTTTVKTEQNYRKSDTYNVLKRRYGYFADKSFPIDCVVDYCVECIRFGRLLNVDYALILVAKHQGCEWAIKAIVEKHLLPMLQTYVSGDIVLNKQNDDRICTILFTVASIVKTSTLDQKVDYFLNIFATCLNVTDRAAVQEAAISAICQMSRFGCGQIYPYLSAWKPTYEINSNVMAMLNTIVYQKSRNFWYGPKP